VTEMKFKLLSPENSRKPFNA